MPLLENVKRFARCEARWVLKVLVTKMKLNAFIATVAMLFLLRGITWV
jgi:ribose/xylose/arabinose/galactoside ABC-type transport system permease subunit